MRVGHTLPVDLRRFAFLDHPGPIPFAHRGGARYAENVGIENTMTAFANAVELGYRYLETDVHATADGVLVAFHDQTLNRVTDRLGQIAALPYDEVSKARIGGREPIPLLSEILAAWPDVRVNIDAKSDGAVRPLAEAIKQAKAQDRVCVSSFSQARINGIRELLGPDVATGLGPPEIWRLKSRGRLLPATRAACVQVPIGWRGVRVVTRRFVERAHVLGLQVHVWTIDDAVRMNLLLDLGVDGIITDRPDTLRDVLVQRGTWAT
jgi:glycerophosphoryl diester phosphodiesterase